MNTPDKIEKHIILKAPLARVWRSLTDHAEFGKWFGAIVESPFIPGKTVKARITFPGFEEYKWEVVIQKVEPMRLFSFTWHPYTADPKRDYSAETPTLVEFRIEETAGGTALTVVESGFSKVPADRKDEAFRMNDGGWTEQVKNLATYVAGR